MSNASSNPALFSTLLRGLKGQCPACGKGRIFGKLLKSETKCSACGEEFHHHRADDFPAYIVVVLVGHIIVPLALYLEKHYSPDYWVHVALWLPMMLVLAILFLQPVKGAVIALQWHVGLHGFSESRRRRDGNT